MFLAYRYARRKYRERQAKQQTTQLPSQEGNHGSLSRPSAAPAKPNNARRPDGVEVTASSIPPKTGLKPEEKAESHRRRSYRWKIVLGLFAPFTLQALDTTIVAAALPTIAEKFGTSSPFPP